MAIRKRLNIPKPRIKKPKAAKPIKIDARSVRPKGGAARQRISAGRKIRDINANEAIPSVPGFVPSTGPGMDMAQRVQAGPDEAIPEGGY